jgi:hypothetical protein
MATTTAQIKNGSSVAFPFGSTLQSVYDMRGATGQAFTDAEGFYNEEITKAIVSAALATNDAAHQTKGATGTQKDIVDLIGEEIEKGLSAVIQLQILRPLLKLNYGDDWAKYTPKVSLSQTEEADIGPVAQALALLKTSGILQDAQLPWAWSMLGAPVLSPDEMDPEPVPPVPGQPGGTNADPNANPQGPGEPARMYLELTSATERMNARRAWHDAGGDSRDFEAAWKMAQELRNRR